MKNFLIFASLLLCTPLTTFTMESHGCQKIDSDFDEFWNALDTPSTLQTSTNEAKQQQAQQNISQDKLLEFYTFLEKSINEKKLLKFANLLKVAINKKCTAINIFGGEYQLRSDALQEKDFFDIIQIIDKYADKYNFRETDFAKTYRFISEQPWYSLNYVEGHKHLQNYLQDTFLYFNNLATKNINNVTSKTLDAIYNFDAIQSIPQLNKLPQYLKRFFMTYAALFKINSSYDITLTGHTDSITTVDVHAATHRAATASNDGRLYIWSLTTGKIIGKPYADGCQAHHIAFNVDGHNIATITNLKDNSNAIRIFQSECDMLLHEKQINIPDIKSLSYKNHTLLIGSGDNPPKMSIFMIQNNKITELEQEIDVPQYTKKDSFCRTWGNYSVYSYSMNKPTIAITKKGPDLYIYQQAIKNDPVNFNVEKIDATDFTEYEKDILQKQLISQHKARNS